MKKLLGVLCVCALTVMALPQGHIHDENCGYDPVTKQGCVYEVMPLDNQHLGN